jgi:PAS domain S-box-containing protein
MASAGKILIVDDNSDSLKLLSGILVAEGYHVLPADSGELALAAVAASPPELILLDMRMPGMSGVEVCRRLKSRSENREIPVIFLSASQDFEDRLEGLEAGAVDFLNKPFRREELLARLRSHLELARLRKDLEQRVAERTADLQVANEQLKNELETRRRVEAELRESEQRFRSIADTAPAGIFISDREGAATYVNQWVLAFAGSTREQVANNRWRHRIHPEDVQHTLDVIAAAIKGRSPYQVEFRHRRFDGLYLWAASTATPRFLDGEFVGHIGIILDIDELKRSQQHALASQKMESLGVLAAGIAHDFGNLLSTILAHSDLALLEIPPESPAGENVSNIATVAVRASEIVKSLMAYAGRADSTMSGPVELSPLIEELLGFLKASLPRTTSIQLHLEHDLPAVYVNAAQVRQAVMNLIINASEALEARPGTVTVSTSLVRVGQGSEQLYPAGLAEGDYALLEVSDTGCGMTEEVKARILDPFFSTKFLGRGMGLASVQGIVRRAGGAISVTSSPGQGSTFRICLPCSDRRPERDGATPGDLAKLTGTVLLVDDEDALRPAVVSALKQAGFAVLEASDGLAAVQLFAANSTGIDIAILDLNLPGLSGDDVRNEIRRLRPEVPVIFTSAQAPKQGEQPGRQTNQRFVQKPYRLKELIETIREMLATPAAP